MWALCCSKTNKKTQTNKTPQINQPTSQTNKQKTKTLPPKRLCCSRNLQFKTTHLITYLAYIKESLSTVINDRLTLIWPASQPRQWQLAFLFWNWFTEVTTCRNRNKIKSSVERGSKLITDRLQSYKQQLRKYLLAEFMLLIFPNATFSSIQRTKWKDRTLKNLLWGTRETRGEDNHYF